MSDETNLQPNLTARIEALLFYFGEPLGLKKMASLLGTTPEACATALTTWETELAGNPARGLMLLRKEERVQLVTKAEHHAIGEAIVKDEFREALTPAALETLSLIAYLGPVPRATVDYVRGVNGSFTLRALVMRGLVERCDEKGMSFRYRVTEQFLKHMGLASLKDLPEYETYREKLRQFEEQLQAPAPAPTVPVPPAEPDLA